MTTPTPAERDAVNDALTDLPLGVHTPTGAEPGEGTVQVLVRVPAASRDRWKAAAEAHGTTLSDFVRQCCDSKAETLLDCQHPVQLRKVYPWAEICSGCGARVWENSRIPVRGPGRR